MKKEKIYIVCIEGAEHDWNKPEITYEEIVDLGGWQAADGILEIDKDQNERPLQPGDVIELKPGLGFSKKHCWKRGFDVYEARIQDELSLLKKSFADLEHVQAGQWILLRDYVYGDDWTPSAGPIAFQMPASPTTPPYAFYVPAGIRCKGVLPSSYQDQVGVVVPFAGNWGVFSWAPEGAWVAGASVSSGSNMLNWALGFKTRFKQGA